MPNRPTDHTTVDHDLALWDKLRLAAERAAQQAGAR